MLKDSVKIKSVSKHKNALYMPFCSNIARFCMYNNTKISWFIVSITR